MTSYPQLAAALDSLSNYISITTNSVNVEKENSGLKTHSENICFNWAVNDFKNESIDQRLKVTESCHRPRVEEFKSKQCKKNRPL